jgi:hypothetical protein
MYNHIPIQLFLIGSDKTSKIFTLCLKHRVKVIKHIQKQIFGGLDVTMIGDFTKHLP